MSGMVLATSAGQSVKKVFCVRPCRTDARSSLTHLARFPGAGTASIARMFCKQMEHSSGSNAGNRSGW
jgi:hypothetical protein